MKGTSKLRSRHLSADRPLQRLRGCFLGDNAAVPPTYQVKVQKCAGFVDILDVCKFTTFCDRKGYSIPVLVPMQRSCARVIDFITCTIVVCSPTQPSPPALCAHWCRCCTPLLHSKNAALNERGKAIITRIDAYQPNLRVGRRYLTHAPLQRK